MQHNCIQCDHLKDEDFLDEGRCLLFDKFIKKRCPDGWWPCEECKELPPQEKSYHDDEEGI